jgi:hypothetical protein
LLANKHERTLFAVKLRSWLLQEIQQTAERISIVSAQKHGWNNRLTCMSTFVDFWEQLFPIFQ